MDRIKAEGIPLWVTLFLCLIILFGIGFGAPAMLGHGLMETQTIGWGGRQLGIAVGSILAIAYRSQVGYLIVFTCAVFKETSDLIEVMSAPVLEMGMVIGFIPFICLELASLWLSYRAAKAN
ncbi:hypothetical protein [Algirhabdus cladophorae]|uniref:hypothetical protein n=1 Tax=Algirhabdus cladophorae TaxID=3377108 RepID=UPI003B84A9DC